eukprot:2064775-Amphidinium_carterae.1
MCIRDSSYAKQQGARQSSRFGVPLSHVLRCAERHLYAEWCARHDTPDQPDAVHQRYFQHHAGVQAGIKDTKQTVPCKWPRSLQRVLLAVRTQTSPLFGRYLQKPRGDSSGVCPHCDAIDDWEHLFLCDAMQPLVREHAPGRNPWDVLFHDPAVVLKLLHFS